MPPRRPCLLSMNNEYLKNPGISQAMEHWHSMQLNSPRIFTKTFAKLKQDLINNLKDDPQWVLYTVYLAFLLNLISIRGILFQVGLVIVMESLQT
jgi:hypothetical protein